MTDETARWQSQFPELDRQADTALQAMMAAAQRVRLPPDTRLFEPGASCTAYLLVVTGNVRVQFLTENGREVVLYHVRQGDTCILTTACLLGGTRYPAEGITETEVLALTVPLPLFETTIDRSPVFRRYVFASLGQRLAGVLARMEDIAFGAVDARLARTLLELCGGERRTLGMTHQALAAELGSAREVVSRHLKRFEIQGWLRLGRGTIEVVDPQGLARLAGSSAP